jgi:regulator of sigma E protease
MAILATVVVLGVLIFVHELGHFWAAKAVGIEVQRFSIGLGPRVWGFTRGETEYVLSAIPLGGYVKMAGMDDEVMERMEGGPVGERREPSDRDFDRKPVWARAVVISAGVFMNMLFALVTYTAIAAFWGEAAPATTRVGTVVSSYLPPGTESLGAVPSGSNLVRIGDQEIRHWGNVFDAVLEGPVGSTQFEFRNPDLSVEAVIPDSDENRTRLLAALQYWSEPTLSAVNPGSPADRAGLERGDRVLAVAGDSIPSWQAFVQVIRVRPGIETPLMVLRDGERISVEVTPEAVEQEDPVTGVLETVGQIGVIQSVEDVVYLPVRPVDAIRVGWDRTVVTTQVILGFLRDLVTGGVSPRSVGSIVTIGEASGQAASAGIEYLLGFMALFSVNLAILNLLPIPVLDGGHLVFLLIEAVRGRSLSVEQRIRASQVGMFVIIGIMLWALSNDFLRLFGL